MTTREERDKMIGEAIVRYGPYGYKAYRVVLEDKSEMMVVAPGIDKALVCVDRSLTAAGLDSVVFEVWELVHQGVNWPGE